MIDIKLTASVSVCGGLNRGLEAAGHDGTETQNYIRHRQPASAELHNSLVQTENVK